MSPRNRAPEVQNAVEMLQQDHQKVDKAFEEFHKLGSRAYVKKKKLADSICEDLLRHAQIEEELFYPACREAMKGGKNLVNEAQVEHESAKNLIQQILSMDSNAELFDAKVKVLGEYVDHHVKEEEQEIFPSIEKSNVDLHELGKKIAQRKEELE